MFEYFLHVALPLSRERSLAILTRALGGVLLCMGVVGRFSDALSPRPPTGCDASPSASSIAGFTSVTSARHVDIDAEVKVPVRYALLVSPLR